MPGPMDPYDTHPYYGMQTIGPGGRSNAGQGPVQPWRMNNLTGMSAMYNPDAAAWQQQQQQLQQQRINQQMQRTEMAGQRNEQMVQQAMQGPAAQNYNDMMQMTPEKVAAYRAAKAQNGTSMQQDQPGLSNGQMGGQEAIANLLRMLGLM